MTKHLHWMALLVAVLTLSGGQAVAAVIPPGGSATTVFGPEDIPNFTGPAVPDSSLLNGLDEFTTFAGSNLGDGPLGGTPNVGRVLFFQAGPLYVGGAGPSTDNPLSDQGLINLGGPVPNQVAYGVLGAGRSDIAFEEGVVDKLTLQLRGTDSGLSVGPTAPNTSLPNGTALGDAQGTLLVYSDLGLELTLQVANADFTEFTFDSNTDLTGDSITRISLINEGPANSALMLGELTATTAVPEPTTLALVGLAAGVATLRGRRR